MSQRKRIPAKPLSSKARRVRMKESLAVLTALQRQAVASSVVMRESLKALPGPKQLHIYVTDTDDWYAFCADLLEAGQMQWWLQGDREARYNNNDPSVPHFKTWAAFRKALLQVGERYWETTGATTRRRGRPDMLGRCLRALWKELEAARAIGRMKYRKTDLVPMIHGHPITQDEVQGMIRKADPELSDPLHNEVCKKYGRLLYLSFKLTHPEQLTPSDNDFLEKYFLPWFKRSLPDLAK